MFQTVTIYCKDDKFYISASYTVANTLAISKFASISGRLILLYSCVNKAIKILTRNAWQSLAYSPPGIAVSPPRE